MALKIVQVGEPVLRQKARALTVPEIRSRGTQRLIEEMREAMYKAPGVGLAAPQIGESIQLAVIEDKAEYLKDADPHVLQARERRPVPFHVLVNPTISLLGPPDVEFFEGCLSLVDFTAVVPRARSVRVKCLNHLGKPLTIEASGWYARILQHEVDHLHGTVYIDRMHSRTFMGMENFNLHWKEIPMNEMRRLLISHEPDRSS
jgi:peptide deformylase